MKRINLLNRTVLLLLIGFMLLSFSSDERPIQRQATVTDPCSVENKVFGAGEEIVYKLYYNWNFVWVAAGEVTFKVAETANQYHLTATGRTYASYEWFYKVRDRYDTYISKDNLLPSTSIKELREGGYRLYDKTTLNQSKGTATCLRGKTRERTKRKEHTIDPCMHDILSIIYYARNLDFDSFDEGDYFPIKIFMDQTTYPLQVHYKGRETAKRIKGSGTYDSIVFSPQLVAGDVFEEDTEMNIWVSDDQNRIPILIESPLSVGSVKAVLKSYKGLKYEMTAKRK